MNGPATTSTQQRLKLHHRVPSNGLVIYCGEIITADGKERNVTIDFEPFKPIRISLYLCDNKFHTETLTELLQDDTRFGFIVMDGNGVLFATLSGNAQVAELAVQCFITNDRVNVQGIVLTGSADFESELNASDMFDHRLQEKVIKVVNCSYGGENGFNQAIDLAADTLSDVKLLEKYFTEISMESGKIAYGLGDTLKALEAGAIETLIVFDGLEVTRWTL
ncbi:MAG: hypothetical protein Q9170_002476 [Blastenia crenularia]